MNPASYNGKRGVYLGIQTCPRPACSGDQRREGGAAGDPASSLPAGIHGNVIYDSTVFVNSSITEVERRWRNGADRHARGVRVPRLAALGADPVIAIPLSLIGTFGVMLALGFSINLLTLLALVLAIGLVVDDAIIVVESVSRHLEEGMRPRDAAIKAARDLANPIIAMTDRAGRRLCADRLPGRADRRAVHRIRLHAGRRRDHVGHRLADAYRR
jgi:multidrug efflux pump